MKLSDLNNKNIAFFGFGIENQALLEYLLQAKVAAHFAVCDQRNRFELKGRIEKFKGNENVAWILGGLSRKNFPKADIVFRSPGWPLFDDNVKRASKAGALISSPMQLFCKLCPTKNLIGITGTKGKGTTSSLIAAILKTAGKNVFLGGNIGTAPFTFLNKLTPADYVVLELSSFQLEDLRASFKAAVFTNFSREHLKPADPHNPNYHKTLAAYFSAKLNIFRYLDKNSCAFINYNLQEKFRNKKVKKEISCDKIIFFKKSHLSSRLIGEHNRENIAAAEECANFLKIKRKYIIEAVAKFAGLEYRLEHVTVKDGIKYYNDSFATIPDATITALKSFSGPVILIAGGADKGNDFGELGREIKKRVKFLVLFSGKALPRIKRSLKKAAFDEKRIIQVGSMRSAIHAARRHAVSGDTILLSPACASFGIFKNYKERGEQFKSKVRKFKNH